MGGFLSLVDMPEKRQAFKAKKNISTGVEIEHFYERKGKGKLKLESPPSYMV